MTHGYFAGMAGPGQLTARYDEWADWYENYVTGEARGFTERAGRALDTVLGPGTGPVLDLACGTGVHAARLRSLGWTPLGLDLSAGQLRHARRRLPVVMADAAVPPLRPGGLAAVAAVMCHTDLDDYPAACRALVPALRPGGVFATSAATRASSARSRTGPTRPVWRSRPATGAVSAASGPGRRAGSGPGSARCTCRLVTCSAR
jgi:SAM-dependent methyltransferase